MTQAANPYDAPEAAVVEAADETQPVKLFSISGRIGRARYIAYGSGFCLLAALVGVMATAAVDYRSDDAVLLLAWGAWGAVFVIGFMLTIQRCHDFGATGWLSLVLLIPLIHFVFWFIPGSRDANGYGPPTPPNSTGMIVAASVLAVLLFSGVFAALMMPAQGGYTPRARVAEALALTRPWQAAIDEHYAATRRLPTSASDLGEAAVSLERDYNYPRSGQISFGANGVLTFTFAKDAAKLGGETIVLRPSVSGTGLAWDCAGGTVERKYRPARCR